MESSKTKIIVLIIVALLAVGAAGYFWYELQAQKAENAAPAVDPKDAISATPVYINLKPFTISMPGIRNGYEVNKVLYIGLILRVGNEKQKSVIEQYLPDIRSSLLLLLSKQSIDELQEESGRVELKDLIKRDLSRFYSQTSNVVISDVFFSDFVIR